MIFANLQWYSDNQPYRPQFTKLQELCQRKTRRCEGPGKNKNPPQLRGGFN